MLIDLAAYRLDLVLADEPASSGVSPHVFNHLLGESGVTFCAAPALARRLRRGFPRSLHEAPALLPMSNSGVRRSLEKWFDNVGIRPRLVGEFYDAALWLQFLRDNKFGGILADEMGLGKTLQTLAFIHSCHMNRKLSGPVLIVCPTSLVLPLNTARGVAN